MVLPKVIETTQAKKNSMCWICFLTHREMGFIWGIREATREPISSIVTEANEGL